MMFLSVRTVGQNVTTYIILSKIQTLISVMNLSGLIRKLQFFTNLSNRFFKRPRIQNELQTSKAPQKMNDTELH